MAKIKPQRELQGLDFPGGPVVKSPMQGTQVRFLLQEDPTCQGATRPVRALQLLGLRALEPVLHN